MADRCRPAGAEVQPASLARRRLHIGHGAYARRRIGHDHTRRGPHRRDMGKRLDRVVRLFVQREWPDGERRRVGQHEGVTVGGRLRHQRATNTATGPGPVVHQHRLAELARQLLGYHARHDVARATGRKGHDDLDRFIRPGGPGRQGECCGASGQQFEGTAASGKWQGGYLHGNLSGR